MTKAKLYFTVGEPQDIDDLEVVSISITGIATLGVTTSTSLSSKQLEVSGNTKLDYTTTTNLNSGNISVSGISTLSQILSQQISNSGILTTTGLVAQNIINSGISTFTNGPVLIGSATSTGTSLQRLQVTGGGYFSGSVGIGTTTPSSTLSVNGLIDANNYISYGTTSVYTDVGSLVVDSNKISCHYITFNTNLTEVNISNFTSGKTFDIIARNSIASFGNRTIVIKTSLTNSNHVIVPLIVNISGNITNGTITVSPNSGVYIKVFNINDTIVASYS